MDEGLKVDLEKNQRRLHYYLQLKEKSGENKPPLLIQKWIDIYQERAEQIQALLEEESGKTA